LTRSFLIPWAHSPDSQPSARTRTRTHENCAHPHCRKHACALVRTQSQLDTPDEQPEALHATALQLLRQRNAQLEALHRQNLARVKASRRVARCFRILPPPLLPLPLPPPPPLYSPLSCPYSAQYLCAFMLEGRLPLSRALYPQLTSSTALQNLAI